MKRLILQKRSTKCCVVYLGIRRNASLIRIIFLIAMMLDLSGASDTVFRGLHEAGVGVQKKSVQVFTRDDKDKFWDTGAFNTTTPQGLQNAVFFMWARCVACVED